MSPLQNIRTQPTEKGNNKADHFLASLPELDCIKTNCVLWADGLGIPQSRNRHEKRFNWMPASLLRNIPNTRCLLIWPQTMIAQKILLFPLAIILGAQKIFDKPLNLGSLLYQGWGGHRGKLITSKERRRREKEYAFTEHLLRARHYTSYFTYVIVHFFQHFYTVKLISLF